ncbi:hypothetical protein FRX31_004200 [Thalictrum thalictroides]|uniref:Neprosin PEP catalytic domain-containing protein n=1 Tax=Thalictrum thalictroides TaxID=46969 RepID=A0A7J6X9T1_THATH|nr:hypothetical protein FRX31_004200 [Thalictrum thalictroides]
MGFGYFPDGSPVRSGYFRNIQVMYSLNNLTDPAYAMKIFEDQPTCYKMNDYGFLGKLLGYLVLYGGTGGACGN